MRKPYLLFVLSFLQFRAVGQKDAFFPGISFDSSYTVLGIGRGYGKPVDSMERFWFILDDPEDMRQLQKEWVFSSQVNMPGLPLHAIDVYVIQRKRLTTPSGLIVPEKRVVTTGTGRWYRFDTASLTALHARHPVHFHSEDRQFQSYREYAAYGNSVLTDSNLLFFFEPDTRFEGKFEIECRSNGDPQSPYFQLHDLNKELEGMAAKGTYLAELIEYSVAEDRQKTGKKIRVHCSKALYERYQVKRGQIKGSWEAEPIQITLFWRDGQPLKH